MKYVWYGTSNKYFWHTCRKSNAYKVSLTQINIAILPSSVQPKLIWIAPALSSLFPFHHLYPWPHTTRTIVTQYTLNPIAMLSPLVHITLSANLCVPIWEQSPQICTACNGVTWKSIFCSVVSMKLIARRTKTSERNKFLRVITSFR